MNSHFLWQDYLKAQIELSKRLGLNWDEDMQDWDLINSNPNNIQYWLEFYKKLKCSEEKYSLMQLIIASFDDYQNLKLFNSELWSECKVILIKEHYLHISIIYYWSSSSGNSKFFISKYIDEVFEEVKQHYL